MRPAVISVDTKKKELVGDFKNAGREWHPQGRPPAVRVHDFQDEELGKVIPYGVYDLSANAGWVIANTTTTKGLRVRAALDTDEYPTGVKVADATMTALHLIPDEFHGDWN